MIYVQFYRRDLSGQMAEGVGDRAVVVLDGRTSSANHKRIAQAECVRRGYEAWRLFRGPSFTRANPIGPLNLTGD